MLKGGWDGGRIEGMYILEPVQCGPLKEKDRGLWQTITGDL